MTSSTVEYLGSLRTKCTHVKSGTEIITDAPTDNNGKGEAFSPTDLVATSYASCMLTIVGIYCQKNKIEFLNATAEVEKIMEANPRKIKEININIDFSSNNWSKEIQTRIIKVAEACPVANTLIGNIMSKFNYKF